MRITRKQLRALIREERAKLLREGTFGALSLLGVGSVSSVAMSSRPTRQQRALGEISAWADPYSDPNVPALSRSYELSPAAAQDRLFELFYDALGDRALAADVVDWAIETGPDDFLDELDRQFPGLYDELTSSPAEESMLVGLVQQASGV